MTVDSRYAPPAAEVLADPRRRDRGARPREVTTALKLLWLGYALGVASSVLTLLGDRQDPELPGVFLVLLISNVVVFALVAALYACIARGRHWARVVLAVLIGLEVIVILASLALPALAGEPGAVRTLNFITAGLDLTAIRLLFTHGASGWFRADGHDAGR